MASSSTAFFDIHESKAQSFDSYWNAMYKAMEERSKEGLNLAHQHVSLNIKNIWGDTPLSVLAMKEPEEALASFQFLIMHFPVARLSLLKELLSGLASGQHFSYLCTLLDQVASEDNPLQFNALIEPLMKGFVKAGDTINALYLCAQLYDRKDKSDDAAINFLNILSNLGLISLLNQQYDTSISLYTYILNIMETDRALIEDDFFERFKFDNYSQHIFACELKGTPNKELEELFCQEWVLETKLKAAALKGDKEKINIILSSCNRPDKLRRWNLIILKHYAIGGHQGEVNEIFKLLANTPPRTDFPYMVEDVLLGYAFCGYISALSNFLNLLNTTYTNFLPPDKPALFASIFNGIAPELAHSGHSYLISVFLDANREIIPPNPRFLSKAYLIARETDNTESVLNELKTWYAEKPAEFKPTIKNIIRYNAFQTKNQALQIIGRFPENIRDFIFQEAAVPLQALFPDSDEIKETPGVVQGNISDNFNLLKKSVGKLHNLAQKISSMTHEVKDTTTSQARTNLFLSHQIYRFASCLTCSAEREFWLYLFLNLKLADQFIPLPLKEKIATFLFPIQGIEATKICGLFKRPMSRLPLHGPSHNLLHEKAMIKNI